MINKRMALESKLVGIATSPRKCRCPVVKLAGVRLHCRHEAARAMMLIARLRALPIYPAETPE